MFGRMLALVLGVSLGSGCTELIGRVSDVGGGPEFQSNVGDRVFFDAGSASLAPQWREALDRQAVWLQLNAQYAIVLEGHADERGSREYNLALGARRAEALAHYLIVQGVSSDRIKTISHGMERPEVVGSDEGARSRNRRVVTTLR